MFDFRLAFLCCFLFLYVRNSSTEFYSDVEENIPESKIIKRFEASQIQCILKCQRDTKCKKSGMITDPITRSKSICVFFGDSEKVKTADIVTVSRAKKIPANVCGLKNEGCCQSWSNWGKCCGGKKTRSCKTSAMLESTYCQTKIETMIVTKKSQKCLQPKVKSCDLVTQQPMTLQTQDQCAKSQMSKFVFDTASGTITHVCSKKVVCVKDSVLVVNSSCKHSSCKPTFLRTHDLNLQFYSTFECIDDSNLEASSACNSEFVFKSIPDGPVHVSVYENLVSMTEEEFYKKLEDGSLKPAKEGYLDNFLTPMNLNDHYGIRLSSLFVAQKSGSYNFVANCFPVCKVTLSTDATRAKRKSIMLPKKPGGDVWLSKPIELQAGKKYFIEGVLFDNKSGSEEYMKVSFHMNGQPTFITSNYLCQTED